MAGDRPAPILVADDDPGVLVLLEHLITSWGYPVRTAPDKGTLLELLAEQQPALVFLDLRFGDFDGLELLGQLRAKAPGLKVVMLTGHGSISLAVQSMHLGACHFLRKPPDPSRLRSLVTEAMREHQATGLLATSPAGIRMIGVSPAMQRISQLIGSVGPTDATVLILGESGTGKELVARAVYEQSSRREGPFVPLNMAALPRELAESLLFGHEQGAFTGADRMQPGACERAANGTLFLDEIGELDLGHQAKLLRFLQERTVQRVGSSQPIQVDTRVIAATNRDLLERVKQGHFREDLYYRLNVVPIHLPPLRERCEDIAPLARHFLDRASKRYRRTTLTFSPVALEAMQAYHWPGNIRQMENLIERLAILCPGPEIGPEALAEEFRQARASEPLSSPVIPPASTPVERGEAADTLRVDQLERQAILDALAVSSGNVGAASQRLGLSQATVYRKVKRYKIDLASYQR